MRIDVLEKLITILAGLAILLVAATVALLSFLPPLRTGISADVAKACDDVSTWLEQQRAIKQGRNPGAIGASTVAVRPQEGQVQTATGETVAASSPKAPSPKEYFVSDASGGVSGPGEVFPEHPWIRRAPGVAYVAPKPVNRLLYQRYQSFEASFSEAQSGGGEFVTTESGENAYQVNWVDPNSMLAQKLGLQPGDKVISVNNQPVGTSVEAGRQLYGQLKNETKFAVLVDRAGQKMVLSFFVRD